MAVRNVLSFDDPNISGMKLNDEVECLPLLGGKCIVTEVLVPA